MIHPTSVSLTNEKKIHFCTVEIPVRFDHDEPDTITIGETFWQKSTNLSIYPWCLTLLMSNGIHYNSQLFSITGCVSLESSGKCLHHSPSFWYTFFSSSIATHYYVIFKYLLYIHIMCRNLSNVSKVNILISTYTLVTHQLFHMYYSDVRVRWLSFINLLTIRLKKKTVKHSSTRGYSTK